MPSPLLTLEGVEKRFGYHRVLQNICFQLQEGEFALLIGNNGAGKSTLVRIICALMKPTQGRVMYQGRNYRQHLPQWHGVMGSLTHESRFYGDLNARENLRLYGTLHGFENMSHRIEEVLTQTDLIHASTLPVRTFSSGMTKRLMIARLLLCRPEFLILDEPFAGLDQNSVHWFLAHLREFHEKGGTVLMVTHQLELGLELASRVLMLRQHTIHKDLPADGLNHSLCSAWLEE